MIKKKLEIKIDINNSKIYVDDVTELKGSIEREFDNIVTKNIEKSLKISAKEFEKRRCKNESIFKNR